MESAKSNSKSKILLIALIIAGCIIAYMIFVPNFIYADELEDAKNNWFVKNINGSLSAWKNSIENITRYLQESPDKLMGSDGQNGSMWNLVSTINGALKALGVSLMVICFGIGLSKTISRPEEVRQPMKLAKYFLRVVITNLLITYSMYFMLQLFAWAGNLISIVNVASADPGTYELSDEAAIAIAKVNWWNLGESIPLVFLCLIFYVAINIISILLLIMVFVRFFKIYIYTAIAPLPLATLAGKTTQNVGRNFIKSYFAVLLQGVVMAIILVVSSSFFGSFTGHFLGGDGPWGFIWELLAKLLIVIVTIKGTDRLIKELFGL